MSDKGRQAVVLDVEFVRGALRRIQEFLEASPRWLGSYADIAGAHWSASAALQELDRCEVENLWEKTIERRQEERLMNEHEKSTPPTRFGRLESVVAIHENLIDDLLAQVKNIESRQSRDRKCLAALVRAERGRQEQDPGEEVASAEAGALCGALSDSADRSFGVKDIPELPRVGDLARPMKIHTHADGLYELGPSLRIVETQGAYVRLEGETFWRANGEVRVVARREGT